MSSDRSKIQIAELSFHPPDRLPGIFRLILTPPAMASVNNSDQSRTQLASPIDRALRRLKSSFPDLVGSLRSPAMDVAYNCAPITLLGYGCGLMSNNGVEGSLAIAGFATKTYVITSSFYFLAGAVLTNLRGKQDLINASLSGCLTNLMRNSFLGSPMCHLLNCVGGGAIAIMDSRRILPKVQNVSVASPSSISNSGNDAKSTSPPLWQMAADSDEFLLELLKRFLMGASLGAVFGFGFSLSQEKAFKTSLPFVGSMAKFYGGIAAQYRAGTLLFAKIRGKDDAINAGLSGCLVGLILSDSPGGPKSSFDGCLGAGIIMAVQSIKRDRPRLPRFPIYNRDQSDNHIAS